MKSTTPSSESCAIHEASAAYGGNLELPSDPEFVSRPPLVSLAAYCGGESVIAGAGRLRHKESDRAGTLREEFGKLGISVEYDDDVMRVRGEVSGGSVYSHGDHRIAMACAVAALGGGGDVEIGGAEAVAKSYPGFFDDLEKLMY